MEKRIFVLAIFFVWPVAARAAAPMNFLAGDGEKAAPVVALMWGLLIISVVVVVIIGALVFVGVRPGRGQKPPEPGTRIAVARPAGGLNWIWIGVSISTFVLLISVGWTMAVLAKVNAPQNAAAPFIIEVTGRQWWWEVRYINPNSSRTFTTANEIHIPTGVPVKFRLLGGDVIHSFWVPKLTGKTDTIPGQTNTLWLDARDPGLYRGQCAEYCGAQHAHMSILVVAQKPAQFAAWWNRQLQDATSPATPALAGRDDFVMHCGNCHAVRGTDAAGVYGPDLSHLASRQMIAANSFPNTPGYLSGWISDPQAMKPENLMPKLELSGAELTQIRTYLETLK